MRKGEKNHKHRNVSAYKICLTAVILTCLAGVPACSNQEAQTEHFNNNSTGMDRDHTQVHKEDTLKVDSSELRDSIDNQH